MLDYLEYVVGARDIQALWLRHCEEMSRYGFSRLLFGLTHTRSGSNFGDPDDFLILSSYGARYASSFVDEGMFRYAPMTRWALDNVGSRSWRWVTENFDTLSADELRVLEFNKQHGIRAGYTISFPGLSLRAKGVMALAAPPDVDQDTVDEIWAEHGRRIWVVSNVLYLRLSHLPHQHGRRALTPRQREVLEWVGDGKTTQDIAALMGVTPATVEKHLRLSRQVLGVETTAQAVLKASVANQIFVLEDRPLDRKT